MRCGLIILIVYKLNSMFVDGEFHWSICGLQVFLVLADIFILNFLVFFFSMDLLLVLFCFRLLVDLRFLMSMVIRMQVRGKFLWMMCGVFNLGFFFMVSFAYGLD